MIKTRLLSFLLSWIYRALSFTWRKTRIESIEFQNHLKTGKPYVLAFWHGDELAAVAFSRYYKLSTFTSTSKDGEIMDGVLRSIGFRTARGSSTRGGLRALKEIIRHSRDGFNPAIAVDGPKGPIFVPKPGVFEVSRIMKAPIFPAGLFAGNKHVFERAWNKSYLPLPFSKVALTFGAPLNAVEKDQDPKSKELAVALTKAINASRESSRIFIEAP
ncbi:MAG: lysophospholipid acyltransferase family protein [Bdellovibrionales bacterium]|nr:lysophospholipid acyltransferase family protein [Bdellovibrionales bacterium]